MLKACWSLAVGFITLFQSGRNIKPATMPKRSRPDKLGDTSGARDRKTGRRARRLEATAATNERESSRLPISIPVTLYGTGGDGKPFRESTRTVNVSKRGARIVTLHDLEKDTYIWIENVGARMISIGKVIRKGKRVNPQEATEICVEVLELLDPEKIWGIEAPPKDWAREFEPPSDAHRLEYLLAKSRLVSSETLSYGAIETVVPEEIIKKKAHGPAGLLDAETSSTEAEGGASVQNPSSHPSIIPPQREGAGEVPPSVSSEATDLSGTARQSSGSQGVGEVQESAPIRRRCDEQILPPAEGDQDVPRVAEVAKESIGLSAEAIRNGLAEPPSATDGLKLSSETMLEDFQAKLAAALMAFQRIGVTKAEELEKNSQGLVDRTTRQLEEQAEKTSRETEKAENSICLACERARAQMQAASEEMESRQAKRMAELSSAEEGLQQQAAELLKSVEGSLDNALEAFQEKGSAGQAELEAAVQGLLESSKNKLQEHADAAIAALSEKARETLLATTAEEARKQVARMQEVLESLAQSAGERFDERLTLILKEAATASRASEAATNRINLITDQAVKRLEAAEKKTKDGYLEWGDHFESRLAGFLTSMEGLACQSETLHRDFQNKLESALQEFLKRKAAETSDLQEVFNNLVERATAQVAKQAEAAIEKLKGEAKAVVRPVKEGSQNHSAEANEVLESAARAAAEIYARRVARTSAEHKEEARLRADEVIASLNRASEDAVARLKAVQEQTEARFAALIDVHEKRITEISSRFEDLEKRSVAAQGEPPPASPDA